MRISAVAFGTAIAVIWGAAFCVMGALHAAFPSYGAEFFQLMGSIYPGMTSLGPVSTILLGVAYGLADGFLFGYLVARLYNLAADRIHRRSS